MHAAMCAEIGSTARKMQAFDSHQLIRNLEAYRTHILYAAHGRPRRSNDCSSATALKSRGLRKGPRTCNDPSMGECPVIFPGK